MTLPLSEKYRPKRFSDIKGQDFAIVRAKIFFGAFNRGVAGKKAILLHGPAGTGKTAIAYALANENCCELFELNASDLRNRKKLDEVLKPSILQKSLFAKNKIILVDEVDGVTSTEYGGLAELIALIEKTKFPMIITANDVWQQKYSLLRQKCELVRLKEIPYTTVLDVLTGIAKKEGMQIDESLLKEVSAKSRGDMRAAINDLQSIMPATWLDKRETEPLQEIAASHEQIGEREKAQDIFNTLKEIFKLKTTKDTINIYDNVEMELDQIALWLEENLPKEYSEHALASAFDALSRADVFKGRIYRQQYWRFLAYQNFFLSAGVSSAKSGRITNPDSFTKYERPSRVLKIWLANQRNAKKKTIAAKYAEYTHISQKRALREFVNISLILNDELAKKLCLSEQEKEFLSGFRGAVKVAHGLNKFAPEVLSSRQ